MGTSVDYLWKYELISKHKSNNMNPGYFTLAAIALKS